MATVDATMIPLQEAPKRSLMAAEFLDWLQPKIYADLIAGKVIMHSPVSLRHARTLNFVDRLFAAFVEAKKLGELHREQIAVRLGPEDVVMPDLLFLRKEEIKRTEPNFVPFVPSLLVEVLSPSSVTRDERDKLALYESWGVQEYWILDPERFRHRLYCLAAGKFKLISFEGDIAIRSEVAKGFYLRRSWLDQPAFPLVDDCLKEILASVH